MKQYIVDAASSERRLLVTSVDNIVTVSDSFSRPDNATQYTSGDLIANSATAGSVAPLDFTASRVAQGGLMVRRATLHKDDDDLTAATFRLHLFNADPTGTAPSNGDNDALTGGLNGIVAGQYCGYFDLDMTTSGIPDILSDGNQVTAGPAIGSEISIQLSSGTSVYGLLEAQDTYTPVSEETFTVTLEIIQN